MVHTAQDEDGSAMDVTMDPDGGGARSSRWTGGP